MGYDMRGKVLIAFFLAAAVAVAVGCHHDKHNVLFTPKEEFVEVPDEPRFNEPPSAEYRKRLVSKEDKAMFGNKMGGQGGLNPKGF